MNSVLTKVWGELGSEVKEPKLSKHFRNSMSYAVIMKCGDIILTYAIHIALLEVYFAAKEL